jgi:peptide chain release factor subunit 1
MARTITWEELRNLAGFEAENGCAISLYLNLDPSVSPTPGDADVRLNSLLDAGAKSREANRQDLTHAERQALRADFERVARFYHDEFTRNGAHGLAMFAAALDNLWRPLPLTEAVEDEIKVAKNLYLAPLVSLVGRGEGALVVTIGRERGQILRLRGGRLDEVENLFDSQPRRHDQGGLSQARYQRHIDNLALEHLRAVADHLDSIVRREHEVRVVIVASDVATAEFSEMLSREARAAVVGHANAEAHASTTKLLEVAAPVLEGWRATTERETVERWREEAGRQGRASTGWEQTLEAASDGRVELLLFQIGVDRRVWRCPACGRLATAPVKCPLDGTALEEHDEGLDLVIHQALLHGGSVWALQHGRDLEPVEGIGALLRY